MSTGDMVPQNQVHDVWWHGQTRHQCTPSEPPPTRPPPPSRLRQVDAFCWFLVPCMWSTCRCMANTLREPPSGGVSDGSVSGNVESSS